MKRNKVNFEDNQKPAIKIALEDLVNSDGLDYAHYVLQSRALVEIFGDGMKPVQRRILYGMYKMGSTPTNKTIKGARVSGEIIGKYHPHGNCVSFNSRFLLQTGESKTIGDLFNETITGDEGFEGYSIDKDGKVVPSKISHVRVGQYANKKYRIHLSNNEIIECTDEHPIRLFNGDFIFAKDLRRGDLLSGYNLYIAKDGVPNIRVFNSFQQRRVSLLDLAKEHFNDLLKHKKGNHIHHKNRNRLDNSLKNLCSLTPSDHAKEHAYDESSLKGLRKGNDSMHREGGIYYNSTLLKNSKITNMLSENLVFYRAKKLIEYLLENNIELTNENYEKYRKTSIVYNAPFISTLKKKGLIEKCVSEFDLNKVIDFSCSCGLNEEIRLREKERKKGGAQRLNNSIMRDEYRFSNVIFNSNIRNISEITKENYVENSVINGKKVNCLFTEDRRNNFLKNNSVYIEKIEVEEVDNEPMYDFTVEGYENALFVYGDKLVCLHNSSVEAAQENMGQAYNTRVPMFRIQGTLGSFPNDSAPSARYYEIALNKQSWELVSESSDKCTPMKITDIGEEYEPIQLPTRFPYLLIQGSSGIAVGYASNIPSHNPDECMNACIAYYKNKLKSTKDILKIMKGPDFPTGGEVLGLDGIQSYFETGSGTFTIRGRYKIEELSRGRTLVNFYELPYQVSVSQVIEAVYKAQDKGQLKEISEVKDLSDGEIGLKCAIYIKSGSNVNKVIEDIFKYTPAQSKFSVNSTALIKGKPTSNIPILEMIRGWCEFRQECFIRKTDYRLKQIETELHKYNGLLAVLVDIDKAISIIRNAKDSEEANLSLQKTFKIDEEQANSILALQLRKLTKADKNEITTKSNELKLEYERLVNILNNESLLKEEIIKELEETKKIISSPRRTEIIGITNEELEQQAKEQAKQERLLDKDVECYIYMKNDLSVYKLLEHIDNSEYSFKSTSKAISHIVTKDGDLVDVDNDLIPLGEDNAINLKQLNKTSSRAISIIPNSDFCNGVLIVSNTGDGNIVKSPYKSNGKLTQLVPEADLIAAYPVLEKDNHSVCVVDESGKLAKTKLSAVRETRQGAGLIKLCSMESDIVGAVISNEKGLIITKSENEIKYTLVEDCPDKGRGGKGYLLHKLPKNDKVISVNFKENYIDEIVTPRGGKGVKK